MTRFFKFKIVGIIIMTPTISKISKSIIEKSFLLVWEIIFNIADPKIIRPIETVTNFIWNYMKNWIVQMTKLYITDLLEFLFTRPT